MRAAFVVAALALSGCMGVMYESASDAGEPVDAGLADGGPVHTSDDAGSPDGGSADDASTGGDAGALSDAGRDGGAEQDAGASTGAACPPSADYFCDDFDDGIDERWARRRTDGASVEETADGESGAGVVLGIAGAAQTEASLELSPVPWEDRAFWGRYYVHADRLPSNHGWLIETLGEADGGGTARYRLDTNAGRLNSRYNHPDITQHGGLRAMGDHMPLGRWVCIEWHYDTSANEMRYFFDGEENLDMRIDGTEDPPWRGPDVGALRIGLKHFQSDPGGGLEIRIDSVAIGSSRIGC